MFDNVAFQPRTGNLVVLEDGPTSIIDKTGKTVPRGNDLWMCLPDGKDDDDLSDGCVRFGSIKDTSAEPTGFIFFGSGEEALVSIQHRNAALRVRRTMKKRRPDRLDWATLRRYYTVDWDFHLILLRNCHNPYLLDMAERLAPYVHRLRQSMNQGAIDVEQAVAEHAQVLDAVRTGDPEAAATAMSQHLAGVRARALADA